MIREYRGAAPYQSCTASGNVLTIAGKPYNLDELQTASQRIIDVKAAEMFAANIIIPPASYKIITQDEEERREKLPVNLDRVTVVLWTKHGENE